VSFNKQEYASASVSDLVYVLSAYALNGTWLGFKNLTTQFQVCGGSVEKRTTWARFGTNFLNQCTLPLSVALNELRTSEGGLGAGQMIFYDLYLQVRHFREDLENIHGTFRHQLPQ
jgi:meckelin